MKNNTEVKVFILLGLTNNPELQVPLFIVFMLIYLVTLIGNLGMIMLIVLDSRLHTPMYFFLSNLSLVDFCYSSTVTPKVLAGLLMGDKVISYNACAAQMFFFALFGTVDSYLLASMAYDRYAAVCKPLHYTSTMTTSVCARLAIGSYVFAFLTAVFDIGDTFSLSFCMSNIVHHFFCDIPAVMTLTCSDKGTNELILVLVSSFTIFFALIVTIASPNFQITSMKNNTDVTDFILLGLTNNPELQFPLFIVFMLIYLVTLVGNLGMILLIVLDSRLHTPMYFFLSNLSLVDFCYSSSVTPKVMAGLLMGDKVISYNACAAQMFFFAVFATAENYLLASMAYDRYTAVCKPLHYTSTMTMISIFYGTVIIMYLQPSSSHSMDTDKITSVFYTMVTPMLNPVVYSLRNKEVKNAFKKIVEKAKFSLGFVLMK
ncbi:olfactory receptor 5B17-like [Suricata suricatta]|uniref:olfactory receptor 5B17-like n=1 Tax=Suricata suricatta TaxID=37032 RepID=UPI00115634E7|nr:olfactory receptor 5B17-like [Suricata suricatta]